MDVLAEPRPGTPVPGAPRSAGALSGSVGVLPSDEDGRTSTRFTVSADETVLPGHYPGFPIFPGVCLVEYVHLSVLATAPAGEPGPELVAVESTRFTGPVYPGDELTAVIDWKPVDGGAWQCRAKVRSGRGDAASVRLRYRRTTEGAPA
ncbi:3-hydroxyacyl-ACP dehydratase FabZ family protein [Streptomyces sp. NPDC101213]|uniref:3-hydroxyacyl-ACP dehydratase FabZ family protein n=1 Tax=unclassified Streptomyces TaxID=2593676 RepID=UPI0036FDAA94